MAGLGDISLTRFEERRVFADFDRKNYEKRREGPEGRKRAGQSADTEKVLF